MSELLSPERVPSTMPSRRTMTMVLEGEIGGPEMADIVDMLSRLSAKGYQQVVIDFAEVSHFDYREVRPLIAWAERLRELGGDVRVSGLSPYVHAIFRSAGAHDRFDYFASLGDAQASFDRAVLVQGG